MELALTVDELRFGYGSTDVLRDITLPKTRQGTLTALLGANAAGKSTLLRCIAGIHHATGRVRIERDGVPDGGAPSRDEVFYLPQEPPPASSLTVFEAVLLARSRGHRRGGSAGRAAEREAGAALARLELDALATRSVAELSGGQRQLVGLAQAVVCRPAVMLLDEPTSSLDLRNQLRLLELIRQIAEDQQAAVMVTVHDLNLAARFADQAVVLHAGVVHSSGAPAEVITTAMLREVYRIDGEVHRTASNQLSVTANRGV